VVLLGPKWGDIVLPIRILSVIMPLRAFEILFIPAMNGLGKSNVTMLTGALSLGVMVCAFIVGVQWGYIGLCWAWLGGYAVVYSFMVRMSIRHFRMNITDIFRTYLTPLISSLGLFVTGIWAMQNHQLGMHPLLTIAVYLSASVILYFAVLFFVDRPILSYLKILMINPKSA